MILMVVPVLALLLGWLLGGKPERLLQLRWRGAGWVLAIFAAQWLLVHLAGSSPTLGLGALLLAGQGATIGWLALNRALPGMKIVLTGALLNGVVMLANGGFMPISPANLAASGLDRLAPLLQQRLPNSKDVLLLPDQIHLAWLGDCLPLAWPTQQVYSPGDLLITGGLLILLLQGMGIRRRSTRKGLRRGDPQAEEPIAGGLLTP
ncbi:MAG: DUF5317 domain-containing protein [Chloroflexota bacterium]|nr:DUF5317 domain-containing protein [Chloroflexota bacterium]